MTARSEVTAAAPQGSKDNKSRARGRHSSHRTDGPDWRRISLGGRKRRLQGKHKGNEKRLPPKRPAKRRMSGGNPRRLADVNVNDPSLFGVVSS
ncbi:hypothetical protein PspLS_00300 [Pyricularia sp. CBS 133598]|nr:hypothetical protein PspLS_00300 [Pyricularia sp. CBS 133598]